MTVCYSSHNSLPLNCPLWLMSSKHRFVSSKIWRSRWACPQNLWSSFGRVAAIFISWFYLTLPGNAHRNKATILHGCICARAIDTTNWMSESLSEVSLRLFVATLVTSVCGRSVWSEHFVWSYFPCLENYTRALFKMKDRHSAFSYYGFVRLTFVDSTPLLYFL